MQSVVQRSSGGARRTAASGSPLRSLAAACLLPLALAGVGCGNNYRPVVSAINPVGPSAQPTKYALAVADPGSGAAGVATLIDFSGDTVVGVLNTAAAPTYLALDGNSEAYVLHSGTGLIDAFTAQVSTSTTSSFRTVNVQHTTLATGSTTPTGTGQGQILGLIAGATSGGTSTPGTVYVTEPGTTRIATLTPGIPPTIRQEYPVAANPVYTVGSPTSPRVYVLSQGAVPGTSLGTATGIENTTTSNAISNVIAVGRSPVYGVVNNDGRRAFVLNSGGDATSGSNGTVSVINTQTNALDTTPRIVVGPNPIWADVDTAVNELAVLNAGDGTTAGSLSVINIPLCSVTTQSTNTNCDATNPVDSTGFGSVLATIPVGVGPVMVAILQDQNKAYIANSNNGNGTVTVVDLQRMVATSVIPVGGTLNWIAATSGTPTGKVYVTAKDTQVVTVIRTDTDAVITTLPLQGYGLAVRVTAQ